MLDLTVLIGLLTVVNCHIVAIAGVEPPGALALATAAATAGFGVIVYSYQMAIARYVIALVLLPVLVVLVDAPEPKDWPGSSLAGLGLTVFVLYLLAATRQLHRERWESLGAQRTGSWFCGRPSWNGGSCRGPTSSSSSRSRRGRTSCAR